MTSTRPYIIRAFDEWIADNNYTPHIVVDAEYPGVNVPQEYIEDGRIVLNIAMTAVQGLQLDNDAVSCQLRFGRSTIHVYIPVPAVLAVYAQEDGRVMVIQELSEESLPSKEGDNTLSREKTKFRGPPHLTVV